jgi:hypothetical protein
MINAIERIKAFYGAKKAERSGLPLINHIHEGLKILTSLRASPSTKDAFALHPMFQEDKDLASNWHLFSELDPQIVARIVEYRATANWCLSECVEKVERNHFSYDVHWKRIPKLSPMSAVNTMLVADKVQNRKDFEAYHKGKHPRSNELEAYFKEWLRVLGISETEYQRLADLCS